jgi:hypothetical protein
MSLMNHGRLSRIAALGRHALALEKEERPRGTRRGQEKSVFIFVKRLEAVL